eukprot:TRINITY_DN4970_c0_g3_i1.p1 TRINITY_DN4970_c0_g3~~TRINITY_DN4970_c0_g3_i1.p1  ORF type:complete len:574 (+),score=93.44 TRINITY_DN4970_c0_g3_i1:248-1969(+)
MSRCYGDLGPSSLTASNSSPKPTQVHSGHFHQQRKGSKHNLTIAPDSPLYCHASKEYIVHEREHSPELPVFSSITNLNDGRLRLAASQSRPSHDKGFLLSRSRASMDRPEEVAKQSKVLASITQVSKTLLQRNREADAMAVATQLDVDERKKMDVSAALERKLKQLQLRDKLALDKTGALQSNTSALSRPALYTRTSALHAVPRSQSVTPTRLPTVTSSSHVFDTPAKAMTTPPSASSRSRSVSPMKPFSPQTPAKSLSPPLPISPPPSLTLSQQQREVAIQRSGAQVSMLLHEKHLTEDERQVRSLSNSPVGGQPASDPRKMSMASKSPSDSGDTLRSLSGSPLMRRRSSLPSIARQRAKDTTSAETTPSTRVYNRTFKRIFNVVRFINSGTSADVLAGLARRNGMQSKYEDELAFADALREERESQIYIVEMKEKAEGFFEMRGSDVDVIAWTGSYDRNAKHVYEQDILRDDHGMHWRVFWSVNRYKLMSQNREERSMLLGECVADSHVVGNMYETPALMLPTTGKTSRRDSGVREDKTIYEVERPPVLTMNMVPDTRQAMKLLSIARSPS